MTGGIVNVLQFALDGVTDQTNAVANNLANANTPGYSDTEVSFQNSLEQAISTPGTQTAEASVAPSGHPAGTDGNNVDLNDELVESEQAALHYSQLSESLTAQFRLIRGASGGGWS